MKWYSPYAVNHKSNCNNVVVTTMCNSLFVSSQTLIVVVGILALVAGNNPITFVVVVPIVIIFWILRTYYMKTSREVKRIEGISMFKYIFLVFK